MRPILWGVVSQGREKLVSFTDLSCGGHDSADMMVIDEIKKTGEMRVA